MIRAGLFCGECGGTFPPYSREVFNSRIGRIHKPCQNGRPVILKRVIVTDEPRVLAVNAGEFRAPEGPALRVAPAIKMAVKTGPNICVTCGESMVADACPLNTGDWPHEVRA